jgi:predicted phosphate transport protein (TIGR00153 family)
MALNNLFTRGSSREKHFFPTYSKQAETAQIAAKYLKELVKSDDPEERKLLTRMIKKQETTGDELLRDFYIELNEAFVTPFDREDMNALAMDLDKFLDFINHSAKTILMYNPKKIDKQIKEIVDNIHEDATTIMQVFDLLEDLGKNHQQISDLCQKVTLIEHAVDDIYGDYISYLFENEKDEIELLKYKEIAQVVEDTTDRAKEVTSTVKSLLIKES